jgi:hypothetical protein
MEPFNLRASNRSVEVEHLKQSILLSSVIPNRPDQIAFQVLCPDGIINIVHELMMFLSEFPPFDIVIINGLFISIAHLRLNVVESDEIFKERLSCQAESAGIPKYLGLLNDEIVHWVISLFLQS